jgi:hypothetical protein
MVVHVLCECVSHVMERAVPAASCAQLNRRCSSMNEVTVLEQQQHLHSRAKLLYLPPSKHSLYTHTVATTTATAVASTLLLYTHYRACSTERHYHSYTLHRMQK